MAFMNSLRGFLAYANLCPTADGGSKVLLNQIVELNVIARYRQCDNGCTPEPHRQPAVAALTGETLRVRGELLGERGVVSGMHGTSGCGEGLEASAGDVALHCTVVGIELLIKSPASSPAMMLAKARAGQARSRRPTTTPPFIAQVLPAKSRLTSYEATHYHSM